MKSCLNRGINIQGSETGLTRLPEWFKQEIPTATSLRETRKLLEEKVKTICVQAKCPNRAFCSGQGNLTFLILGPACTRSCRFCAVNRSKDRLLEPDKNEPAKIALAVKRLKIAYAVITSVSRDDLEDCGAKQFGFTVKAIRNECPKALIEVLIPDFQGKTKSLQTIIQARPEVIGHNLETVSRLYPRLRPEADYRLSLEVLRVLKSMDPSVLTKSSLMLGLSESEEELVQAMKDLRSTGCDILTLGQYLSPSPDHEPVSEYIPPDKFSFYRELALKIGFRSVSAGPLVRSSFQAEQVYRQVSNQ